LKGRGFQPRRNQAESISVAHLAGSHKEVVIPNGVVCREESGVDCGVSAAGKQQIPPLRVRNDNTFCGSDLREHQFSVAHLAGLLKKLSFQTASFAVRNQDRLVFSHPHLLYDHQLERRLPGQ
jgi:hypothetical protein